MNHIVAIEGFATVDEGYHLFNTTRYLLATQDNPPQFTVEDLAALPSKSVIISTVVFPAFHQVHLDRVIIRINPNSKRAQLVFHVRVANTGAEHLLKTIAAAFPDTSLNHIAIDETKVITNRFLDGMLVENKTYPGLLGNMLRQEYGSGCDENQNICLEPADVPVISQSEFTRKLRKLCDLTKRLYS